MHLLGEKIRVTVRLYDVRDGKPLWGYECEEYCADIFAAQDAISQKVAEALALELSPVERKRLAKHYTDNLEVYQLYVKGQYFRLKLTEDGLRRSLEYFNLAIEKDPNYALAYSGLAASYGMMLYWGYIPRQEGFAKYKTAVMKAFELDDLLVEAHGRLGAFKAQLELEWDWEGGKRAYKRALEINPNYPETHHLYANYYAIMGRFDEAIASRRRALQLDPLSLRSNFRLGADLLANRQYREAIEQYRHTIELDPSFPLAYSGTAEDGGLGLALELEGRHEEAIAAHLKAASLSGEPAEVVTALREAYQAKGMRGFWQKKLELMKKRAERQDALLFDIAVICARLGDKEQAFAWLERAYQERDPSVVHIKNVPELDILRSDPRYADLLRRMRLPL
jgi:tetratricopeptide (TPR) repeat protein